MGFTPFKTPSQIKVSQKFKYQKSRKRNQNLSLPTPGRKLPFHPSPASQAHFTALLLPSRTGHYLPFRFFLSAQSRRPGRTRTTQPKPTSSSPSSRDDARRPCKPMSPDPAASGQRRASQLGPPAGPRCPQPRRTLVCLSPTQPSALHSGPGCAPSTPATVGASSVQLTPPLASLEPHAPPQPFPSHIPHSHACPHQPPPASPHGRSSHHRTCASPPPASPHRVDG